MNTQETSDHEQHQKEISNIHTEVLARALHLLSRSYAPAFTRHHPNLPQPHLGIWTIARITSINDHFPAPDWSKPSSHEYPTQEQFRAAAQFYLTPERIDAIRAAANRFSSSSTDELNAYLTYDGYISLLTDLTTYTFPERNQPPDPKNLPPAPPSPRTRHARTH